MSKALLACFRNSDAESLRNVEELCSGIASRLFSERPSASPRRAPHTLRPDPRMFAACFDPVNSVGIGSAAIRLGVMTGCNEGWMEPGSTVGNGTFALLRASDCKVELVSDALATRSLWYFHDENCFIAASSQRLIAMLLGTFAANAAGISWMLANGVAGPVGGWDHRVQRVRPNSSIMLDRNSWDVSETKIGTPQFAQQNLCSNLAEVFFKTLREELSELDIDWPHWRLPISGGYDSRLIACALAPTQKIETLTWDLANHGNAASPETAVAVNLTKALRLPHQVVKVTPSDHDREKMMTRFVRASEGLSDSIGGYLDGFAMWAGLAADGVDGILRGDEPFGGAGWGPIASERDVRLGLGLARLDEMPSTQWLGEALGDSQLLPIELRRELGESLTDWRHRLYCQYRVPVALAGLTEAKTGFVEVINPLQSHTLVNLVSKLPSKLRDNKALLVETVHKFGPSVPFASIREADEQMRFLRSPETVAILRRGLDTDAARAILGNTVIEGILRRVPVSTGTIGRTSKIRWLRQSIRLVLDWTLARLAPSIKRQLRAVFPAAPIDPCLLALRAWIVVQIHQVLAEDAQSLRIYREPGRKLLVEKK